ncbi:MAG: flagellar biosynthesis protein FlgD [Rhizobiales bacterium]|nr:flagellar biosynthesis protein FlgD [Hyphomicrobiales bacterium]
MVDAVLATSSSSVIQSLSKLDTAKNTNTVNYDAFLQLLVTQIKNQDPTDPQDSGEFLAQIASFSSVEQQIQTNETLEKMLTQNLLQGASDLIDRQVFSFNGSKGGTVIAVSSTSEGLVVETENGDKILVDDTVTIRAKPSN